MPSLKWEEERRAPGGRKKTSQHSKASHHINPQHGRCGSGRPLGIILSSWLSISPLVAILVLVAVANSNGQCIHHLEKQQPSSTNKKRPSPSGLLTWSSPFSQQGQLCASAICTSVCVTDRCHCIWSLAPREHLPSRSEEKLYCLACEMKTEKEYSVMTVWSCVVCCVHLR